MYLRLTVLAALLCLVSCQRTNIPEKQEAKPAQAAKQRPVYRHSVIPGGVESPEELKSKLDQDPVAREHYRGLEPAKFHPVKLDETTRMRVSYRTERGIFWTAAKVEIPKGETVLTDGKNLIRARCGNRLSSDEAASEAQEDEPAAEELNQVEDGPSWSSASGPFGGFATGGGSSRGSAGNPHAGKMLADLGQSQFDDQDPSRAPGDPPPMVAASSSRAFDPLPGAPPMQSPPGTPVGTGQSRQPGDPSTSPTPPPEWRPRDPGGSPSGGSTPSGSTPSGGTPPGGGGRTPDENPPSGDPDSPGNAPPPNSPPRSPSPGPSDPPGGPPSPPPGEPGPEPGPKPEPPAPKPPAPPPGKPPGDTPPPTPGPLPPEIPLPRVPPDFRPDPPGPPRPGPVPPTDIPEPTALFLTGMGLIGLMTTRLLRSPR